MQGGSETGLEAPPRVRVLLAWRQRILGEAAASLLEQRAEIDLIAATGSLDAADRLLDRSAADVLVVDASVDAGRVVDLTFGWKERFPKLQVVAYGLPSEERAVELIEAGASAVVPGEASPADMVRTIVGAASGRSPAPLPLAVRVAARIEELIRTPVERREAPAAAASLSERELEVLALMANGLRNKEIAHRLGIRTATVKNHVHAVLEKLGVRKRREAVRCAYETELLGGSFHWRLPDEEP